MTQFKLYIENKDEVGIDGLIRRIACPIVYYRGAKTPQRSTYEYTKEVYSALETLLNLRESTWSEWIPLLVERYTPPEFGSKDAEYFKKILLLLLQKFSEEAKKYNPFMRRELAKMIRNALDSAVTNPYPEICFYVKEFHSEALSRDRFKKCQEVIKCDSNP